MSGDRVWVPYWEATEVMTYGAEWPDYIVTKWEQNQLGERRFLDSRTYRAPTEQRAGVDPIPGWVASRVQSDFEQGARSSWVVLTRRDGLAVQGIGETLAAAWSEAIARARQMDATNPWTPDADLTWPNALPADLRWRSKPSAPRLAPRPPADREVE